MIDKLQFSIRNKKHIIAIAMIVFIYFLIILLAFISQQTWFCDENDNFLGAMTIVHGGDIYKDFCSQHMPLMYYLCAVFYLIGARTVVWYRLFFDIFTAALWTAMYFRYKPYFGRWTMLLGPTVYVAALASSPDTAVNFTYTAVLSDKLQAYGMVILLLEFLIFANDKKRYLRISNCCWISFAVFISFGSTFVSIFGIFITGVCVLCIEIRDAFRGRRTVTKEILMLLKKYLRLFAIVMIPFLILIIWYAVTGNLKNFYHGAFLLNTKYYAKYNGGYGTSVKLTMLQAITDFFCQGKYAIQAMTKDLFYGIWMLVFFGAGIILPAYYLLRDKLMAISLILILAESSVRGYFNFHAVAYFALSAFMMAIVLQYVFGFSKKNSDKFSGNAIAGFAAITVVILFIPYIGQFTDVLKTKSSLKNSSISESANDLKKITAPNEKIGALNTVVTAATLVQADRCMINGASSTPWTNDMWGGKELQLIKDQKPRVVLCSADYDVWGHKFTDYAKPTYDYVMANYTRVGRDPMSSDLWIRNDCVQQVRKQLEIVNSVQEIGKPDGVCETSLDNLRIASQYFVAKETHCDGVGMMLGTYNKIINTKVELTLTDITANKQVNKGHFDLSNVKDNAYYDIAFSNDLTKDHQYRLDISPISMGPANKAVLYISNGQKGNNIQFAEIDGKKENYNFCIQLFDY